ncbi:unnamed protein product [Didymodactylos carnosus]|uniref:EGF-like domain-containing protein n=1 Tax=Didymodactylos carnosus TaxID=1234261 RepID=A0A8S2FFS5_9BILA|nr:unnamed protein product [Didymodactylos carnosus]CAF4247161.1 unnamed protein product [Didymodactylos carnosus]
MDRQIVILIMSNSTVIILRYQEICNQFEFLLHLYGTIGESEESNCDEWPCRTRYGYCNGIWDRPNGCDELYCPNSITSFITHNLTKCQLNEHYCGKWNQTKLSCLPLNQAGDGIIDCLGSTDELRCNNQIDCIEDGEDEWLCDLSILRKPLQTQYEPFSFKDFELVPSNLPSIKDTVYPISLYDENHRLVITKQKIIDSEYTSFYCNRGLLVRSFFGHDQCLCSPSYYGSRCQFQSERLTISFLLEILHDAVLQFPFLPVNRLAIRLIIDNQKLMKKVECDALACSHGTCMVYMNSEKHFCSCYSGWMGEQCNIKNDQCLASNCSNNSKCISNYLNNTFCLCLLGRLGSDCYVSFDPCKTVNCLNDGTCIPLDDRTVKFACICKHNYFGSMCQYQDATLAIKIEKSDIIPITYVPLVIVHFLHSPQSMPGAMMHRNFFIYTNVEINLNKIFLIIKDNEQQYIPSFVFVQLFFNVNDEYGRYYLILLNKYNLTNATTSIMKTNYCPHADEYLNNTVREFVWLRKIKYYHRLCRLSSPVLKCFFDEIYMCLCDQNGLTDCLNYNHATVNCTENKSYCQNNGRCLQRKQKGQYDFVCLCPDCYYGALCHITMTQYALSLDAIIGSEILTDTSLVHQPTIILLALVLALLMVIVGIVFNTCSIVTFAQKKTHELGCGYYLLTLGMHQTRTPARSSGPNCSGSAQVRVWF